MLASSVVLVRVYQKTYNLLNGSHLFSWPPSQPPPPTDVWLQDSALLVSVILLSLLNPLISTHPTCILSILSGITNSHSVDKVSIGFLGKWSGRFTLLSVLKGWRGGKTHFSASLSRVFVSSQPDCYQWVMASSSYPSPQKYSAPFPNVLSWVVQTSLVFHIQIMLNSTFASKIEIETELLLLLQGKNSSVAYTSVQNSFNQLLKSKSPFKLIAFSLKNGFRIFPQSICWLK